MITNLALAAALPDPVCDWIHPGSDSTASEVRDTLRDTGIDSPEPAAKVRTGGYSELVGIDGVSSLPPVAAVPELHEAGRLGWPAGAPAALARQLRDPPEAWRLPRMTW